jgi:hypothetical protein
MRERRRRRGRQRGASDGDIGRHGVSDAAVQGRRGVNDGIARCKMDLWLKRAMELFTVQDAKMSMSYGFGWR